MSKGSKARPFEVPYEDFAKSWEKTFGKKDVKEEKPSAGLSKEKKSEVVKKAKKGVIC